MEPHAAQDRLSFVCNWKHMHCEAKSKAEPPQPTAPPLHLPFPSPGSWVPHSGPGQVAGHIAEPESIYWTSWPGITCQIQFNGTTVSCVLRTFQGSGTEIWVAVESLLRKEALTLSLTCYENTSKYCTVHSVRSVMSGRDRPWMQGRTITNSYITAFSTRARLHKGRIYDIY